MDGAHDIVYLDHAATTPVRPEVVEAMQPYFAERHGNPSSLYRLGQESLKALDQARTRVAEILGAKSQEVIFTSCGSESDNLAVRGVAFANRERGTHIITSSVEHHAVLHTCEQLEKHFGFDVTYLPVDRYGQVAPADVEAAITDGTVLISVMYANNEVGTIQPVHEIGLVAHEHGIPFHTDAVQAAGYLDLNVDRLSVDLLSLSAHKFHGPKGVGVLYVRHGTPLLPTQTGGSQEENRRAGTENIPGIVGLATALKVAYEERKEEVERLAALRDRLIEELPEAIPHCALTGHPQERLPGSASFIVDGVEAETMLLGLDMKGICASSGSACTVGSIEPSHVLMSMGYESQRALSSLRLTLGHGNTEEEVGYVLEAIPDVIERLRSIERVSAPVSERV